jgi:DNA repair protein RecO (recombination protein O)
MHQKTRAIVLNHVKYGESGLIVRVITENFGRQSIIVHGVRKKKAKLNYYLFEPFTLLDLDLYYKQTQTIHALKEAKPIINLQRLHFDVSRSTIAVFLSEVIDHSLQEVECNRALFNFLYHSIQILDVADKGIENFHLIFLIHFSKFLGIYPENSQELSNYQCPEPIQISDLLDQSFAELPRLNITSKNRSELLDQMILYFQHHLDGMGEIKSLPVFHTVFH